MIYHVGSFPWFPVGTLCTVTGLPNHKELQGKICTILAEPRKLPKENLPNEYALAYMTNLFCEDGKRANIAPDALTLLQYPTITEMWCKEKCAWLTRPLSECDIEILDGL